MYKYYYSKLSDEDKEVYDALLQGFCEYQSEFQISPKELSVEKVGEIKEFVMKDYPLLFYVDNGASSRSPQAGTIYYPEYYFSKIDTLRNMKKVKRMIADFMQRIVAKCDTEYEVALLTYRSLCAWMKYDYLAKDHKKDEWDIAVYAHTLLGVFYQKLSVCEGIAEAFKACMDQVGIPCISIDGYTELHKKKDSELHRWNLCLIDGQYAHFDVTWDLRWTKEGKYGSETFDYFGVSDELIGRKDRTDTKILPKCNSDKLNYYERKHMVAHSRREMVTIAKEKITKVPCTFEIILRYNCDLSREIQEVYKAIGDILKKSNITPHMNGYYYENKRRVVITIKR